MKQFVIFVGLIFSQLAFAGSDASTATFHIQQIDKDVPVEQFAGPGITVHKADEKRSDVWSLPRVETRDKAFSGAGLSEDLKSWDQLDRDMLFLRARASDPNALASAYPKISKKKLRALADAVKEAP